MLGLSLWTRQNAALAGGGGGASTAWSAATSSANWSIAGLSASSVAGGDALLRADTSSTDGSFTITINSITTDADIQVGVSTAAKPTNDWLGDTGGVGYANGGLIWKNAASPTSGASYAAGDVITVTVSGGFVSFKKNGVAQGSPVDITSFGAAVFPAASTGGTGSSVTADFTNWP